MYRFETDPPLVNSVRFDELFQGCESNSSPESVDGGKEQDSLEVTRRQGPAGGARNMDHGLVSSVRVTGSQQEIYENDHRFRTRSEPAGHAREAEFEGGDEDQESVSSSSRLYEPIPDSEGAETGEEELDVVTLLQAIVFVEDAVMYRSVHHKVDLTALYWYRIFYSRPVRWFLTFIIAVLHLLAFIEWPSSLSWSSDIKIRAPRLNLPCGATEGIECVCLLVLLIDLIFKVYLVGRYNTVRSKWLLAYVCVLVISIVDWLVSISLGCSEIVRVRRMLRPFFILQNSSLMKKTFNCLRRTLPEVASVLLLLTFHLYVFTLFGMLLFPKPKDDNRGLPGNSSDLWKLDTIGTNDSNIDPAKEEGSQYFHTLTDSLLNLLVLLTTANNPDVTMPAYKQNRLYEFYFMAFLIIGLYCFMNMLTAVIYNQFRGYFLNSMQASLFRRRLGIRAGFEVLRQKTTSFRHFSSINIVSDGVEVKHLRAVVEGAKLARGTKRELLRDLDTRQGCMLTSHQFNEVFNVLDKDWSHKEHPEIMWSGNRCFRVMQAGLSHKYFTYLGNLIAILNVVLISLFASALKKYVKVSILSPLKFELATRYDHSLTSSHSTLGLINMVFIVYYLMEQSLKVWALGWRRYVWNHGNVFDGLITVILVIVEVFYLVKYGTPFSSREAVSSSGVLSLWNIVRIINILIMVRLFRIIPHIKAMTVVASTLIDLVRNMKSFGGILVAIYYTFAILGIELFQGKIQDDVKNSTNSSISPGIYQCGSYKQLDYWANNFDDFAAAIVVLWDVMVVNNWHVFLHAYSGVTNGWSNIYFITWWLLSVVIVLNLFTAIILENFIMKWDRSHQTCRERNRAQSFEESTYLMSVHEMFRENLREPAENELLVELRQHRFLQLGR